MIWESGYWKDDLLRRADVLARRTTQRRWPEASLARVEQDLLLGFYAVRKLIEASKLTDAVARQVVRLTVHPPTGKQVTNLNWHKLDVLFDLRQSVIEQRDLNYVCHQFVHSYVFMAVVGETGGLHGFFFASDRQRHAGLYYLSVGEVIRIFRQVGGDYPNSAQSTWDPKLGDYRVRSWTRADDPSSASEGAE